MAKRRLDVANQDFLDYMAATPPAGDSDTDDSDDDGLVNEVYDDVAGGSDAEDFGGVVELSDNDETEQTDEAVLNQDEELPDTPWTEGSIDPQFPVLLFNCARL